MKTRTEAAKILIEAGLTLEEVNHVLGEEIKAVNVGSTNINIMPPFRIETETIEFPSMPMKVWY